MSQEGGLQDRLDDERDWLILAGVPDWGEQEERARYEDHWQAAEDVRDA